MDRRRKRRSWWTFRLLPLLRLLQLPEGEKKPGFVAPVWMLCLRTGSDRCGIDDAAAAVAVAAADDEGDAGEWERAMMCVVLHEQRVLE